MNCYCILCGDVARLGPWPQPGATTPQTWLAHVRLIGDDTLPMSLSGEGYLLYHRGADSSSKAPYILHASRYWKSHHWKDPVAVDLSKHPNPHLCHALCWDLFVQQVLCSSGAGQSLEPPQIARELHLYATQQLYNFGLPFGMYGGSQEWGFVKCSPDIPSKLPRRNRELIEHWERYVPSAHVRETSYSVDSPNDLFAKLPYEIIAQILLFISTKDLCNLRCASKSTANVVRPSALPQSYWHSRFDPEMELGFLYAGQSSLQGKVDWRRRFGEVSAELTNREELTGHLRNRRRIWELLWPITRALGPILQS